MYNKIEEFCESLADIRIKPGVDFSVVHKYGETRILCYEGFKDGILEAAQRTGLIIDEVFTYKYHDCP